MALAATSSWPHWCWCSPCFSRARWICLYIDALYFVSTTVTTVGYGDIALRDASTSIKLVGIVLMFAGAAFIALLFGLFTDWVVGRRLEIVAGRVRVRGSGHIVIAGGGNIGVRVAERLRGTDQRVVIIERNADNKNIEPLRANGHHVILADAAREATLSLAKVEDSAAMLCLTDSDAVNFQIALLVRAQEHRPPHRDSSRVSRTVRPRLRAWSCRGHLPYRDRRRRVRDRGADCGRDGAARRAGGGMTSRQSDTRVAEERASIMGWISAQASTLVARFGSPLYVYDAAAIEQAFRRFRGAFRYEPLDCHYAIVCNKNHYIVRLLFQQGAGIHANTPGDAYAAARAGVPGDRIVYSGTNLNAADLDWLLRQDVQMNVDSLDQLRDLVARQPRSGVGLRLLIDDERSRNRIGVTAAELPAGPGDLPVTRPSASPACTCMRGPTPCAPAGSCNVSTGCWRLRGRCRTSSTSIWAVDSGSRTKNRRRRFRSRSSAPGFPRGWRSCRPGADAASGCCSSRGEYWSPKPAVC